MISQIHLPQPLKRSPFLSEYIRQNKIEEHINHNSDSFVKKIYKKEVERQKYALKHYFSVSFLTGMCQPLVYYDNDELNCAGVTNYDIENKTGTFLIETSNFTLKIDNVHSYFVYAKLFNNDKYYVLDYKHIAEKIELNDIYVAVSIKKGNEYKLCIYHNNEIVFEDSEIYPELTVDFDDTIGSYKTRISYVRYSKIINHNDKSYSNYIYSFDDFKMYQLDDSIDRPSAYIEFVQFLEPEHYQWYRERRISKNILCANDAISIFLHFDNSKTSQIVSEYIKDADKVEQVQNVFANDDSVNLKVTYINRPLDVRFLYYCYIKEPLLFGSVIMGVPMKELIKGTLNNPHEHIYVSSKNSIFDVYYCKRIVRELFAQSKESRKIYRLPRCVYENCVDSDEMGRYVYHYLRDHNENISSSYKLEVPYLINSKKDIEKYFSREIELYDNIFQRIASEGGYSNKWKNELSLFQMLKKVYPDAIYQYHTDWLGLQSLDIYIPSINTGFEYQGRQHYEVVEHFGGMEGFERRKRLDQKKRDLCQENGVKLIEWRYDEPISKVVLKDKLAGKHDIGL